MFKTKQYRDRDTITTCVIIMEESQESQEPLELKEKKINELVPFDRQLQVKFVVLEKGEARPIVSKRTQEEHTVSDIKIGDETGTIILTLWDDTIDQLEEGQTYLVKNGYVNVFQQHMRLALGKRGTVESVDEDGIEVDSVNTDLDKSQEVHEVQRQRRGHRPRRSFRPRRDNREQDRPERF